MAVAVRHIGIVVRELNRGLQFYRDLLGLQEIRTMQESGAYIDKMLALQGVQVTTVKLGSCAGDALVELLAFHSHPPGAGPAPAIYAAGPSHVAFTVPDLDQLYQRLVQAGVSFNAPPQLSPDGFAKVTYCHDFEGIPVELVQELKPRSVGGGEKR